MAKLTKNTGLKKIDLEDIILKDNVRTDYTNIEELALSIERDGQVQPVVVSPANDNGYYILTAGYRRFKAHKLLVEQGKPFNQIEAIVKTGDFDVLQLIENIQRENLSPKELEFGLRKMINSGMSQSDIAKRLNKSKQWVSGCLKAEETRAVLENEGIETKNISTAGVEKLSRIPKKVQKEVLKKVKIPTVKNIDVAIKEMTEKQAPKDIFLKLKKEVKYLVKEYDLDLSYIIQVIGKLDI